MKVHIFPWKDELAGLEDALVSRGFKVLRSDKGLDKDSFLVITDENSVESLEGKYKAMFVIISKEEISVKNLIDTAGKVYFYSLSDSEKIHKMAEELDTELLVHDKLEELSEEVLIDIISEYHKIF